MNAEENAQVPARSDHCVPEGHVQSVERSACGRCFDDFFVKLLENKQNNLFDAQPPTLWLRLLSRRPSIVKASVTQLVMVRINEQARMGTG